MTTKTFEVPNIGCAGCVAAIKNELSDLEGVSKVEGSVDTRMVTVEFGDPASWQVIVTSLTDIEYPPAES